MRFFMTGMAPIMGTHDRRQEKVSVGTELAGIRYELRHVKEQMQKMALMNQALWELVRSRTGLTDEDLAALAQEIDLRDGIQDGKISESPLKCPQCGRVSNSRHWKCLYCGLEFEKPAMG